MKKIQTRLLFSFFFIILLLFIQGFLAYKNIQSIRKTQRRAYSHRLQINDHKQRLSDTRLLVFKILGTMDPAQMDIFHEQFKKKRQSLETALKEEGIEKEIIDDYFQKYDRIIALHYDFRPRTARQMISRESKRLHETLVNKLQSHSRVVQAASEKTIENTYRQTLRFTFGILAAGIMIALLLAFLLARTLTDRHQAEKEIRKNEEKYRNILDNASAAIFIKDLDGRYQFVNKRFETIHGVTAEKIQGLTDFDIFPEETARQFRQHDLAVLDAGEPMNMEETEPRQDGVHTVVSTKFPLHTLEKEAWAVCGIATDITELKQAQEALAKSEERLNLALDAVSDAIWDWRVDTAEVYFSSRWYTMLGYAPYELPQAFDTWRKLLHPEDRPEAEKQIFHHLELAKPFQIEFRMQTRDGQWRWILARGKTVETDDQGRALRMLGTHMDITDRKNMEKSIQQTQKMESIGSLAGGIAHDFNNILFPILGLSEMLMEEFPEESDTHQSLSKIFKAGRRGSELVKQILSFSRQSEDSLIPVQVHKVLKDVLKLCRPTIPADIELRPDIREGCGHVMANPTQLHQIAMNLITNAYHAIEPEHGTISIELSKISLKAADIHGFSLAAGRYVLLRVSDTGSGIEPAVMDRIFDPYFTTKEKGKGTGLGLSVVHGIIKAYNGDIKVYSEIGKGTTVSVYLPLMAETVEIDPEETLKIDPAGDENILLVDDEAEIARMMERMLQRLGYSVTIRYGSLEALETFRASPDAFDLVITDMTMPQMTGDQLAEALMALRPDVPIIICTGFSERINRDTAAAMGIKGFLMKPVTKSDIAGTVRKVLDEAGDTSQT